MVFLLPYFNYKTMILYWVIWCWIIWLLYAFYLAMYVEKQDVGNKKMQKIAQSIAKWAMSFLKAEYKVLAIFIVIVWLILAFTADSVKSNWTIALAFLVWAVLSALAWFIGMKIATKANVRTTQAASKSLKRALKISFSGWSVMGISVVSLWVIWLSITFLILQHYFNPNGLMWADLKKVLEILTGFSLGAESIALFARVWGGIYTKAADVWADLVGKVEAWIPEDDPRNPAVIADNVWDNVWDVAGMWADLFGSYVSTILATMILWVNVVTEWDKFWGMSWILLPLLICGMWIIFSILGINFVKIKKESSNPQVALNIGNFAAIVFTAIASYFAIKYLFPTTFSIGSEVYNGMNIFITIVVWLIVGTLMSLVTEYYCAKGKSPVLSIVKQSATWAGTNVIAWLSVGMMSTALPILILALGIVIAFHFGWVYWVAIAATGMMATTGIQLAIDAFGPIADNAGWIAEMAWLDDHVREKTDILDSVGNTTAAIWKWFAIASAALTSLALFAAYKELVWITTIDISNAKILAWLFIGWMIPFLFSALAIKSVGKAAMNMVEEVRRQFREIPWLLEWKEWVEADYEKCVSISTHAAVREMILPWALTIVTPVVIWFIWWWSVLWGYLVWVTVCWVLMAIFQSNAGWAWDNAKKSIEAGIKINGEVHKKWSTLHKNAVVWDTVGDPLKDTSWPSLNILIKLTCIVALIIAPMI